jgi:hypothetical protein
LSLSNDKSKSRSRSGNDNKWSDREGLNSGEGVLGSRGPLGGVVGPVTLGEVSGITGLPATLR